MPHTISSVSQFLEAWAPPSLAEDYDNVGLLVGQQERSVSKILVSLDVTEAVVDEAISEGCELIVSHHPILFKGLKRLNSQSYVARTVEKAIENRIGLYTLHTNLDNVSTGVNQKMAHQLGLKALKILRPKIGEILQLSFFVPQQNRETVLSALHAAGAGQIGNYSECSFSSEGLGRFKPGDGANPTIGNTGQREEVAEFQIQVSFPKYLKNKVLKALFEAHPYEEVAYFLSETQNSWQDVGSGMIGSFTEPIYWDDFSKMVKQQFGLQFLKYTQVVSPHIRKVAVCGGSGFFLLNDAKAAGADVFITSDVKYHEFFDAEGKIILMDIGHFESEQFTSQLIVEQLSANFRNIAVLLSKVRTNPVFYA